jgi:Type IV conjugative transfer system lipoprotein (TraV)
LTKFIVTIVLFFFLQACATGEKPEVDPVAMYKKGMEEGNKAMVEEVQRKLKQKDAYGYGEPYYPLRLPSDIRKVWIVDHPNEAGDLIQGHWVFMVVTAGRWASFSFPSVHPKSGERTSHTVPVMEDKPAPAAAGAQGKMNASQSQ